MNWFKKKYRIYCNRWMIREVNGQVEIFNDEIFVTQHTGNNAGRLQAKCFKLMKKYAKDDYCYHFYIGNNKDLPDMRKM